MIRSRKGFTLIEVLIALSIFTIIGLATVRHIQQLVSTKAAAFSELDLYNALNADTITRQLSANYETATYGAPARVLQGRLPRVAIRVKW